MIAAIRIAYFRDRIALGRECGRADLEVRVFSGELEQLLEAYEHRAGETSTPRAAPPCEEGD